MLLPIVTKPNPILKAQARLIDPSEIQGLQILISDMFNTLAASGGVGLAAPQIGQSLNLRSEDTLLNSSQWLLSRMQSSA